MGRYDKYKDRYEAKAARDEEIKKHQDEWRAAKEAGDAEGMKRAHDAQVENISEYDSYSRGQSSYNPEKGTWNLSDGERTENDGVTGNSYLNPYYNRALSRGAREYDDAYGKYKYSTFSYDPETDPDYAIYKKEYERAGRMAMDDAMARSAARTGGVASSYAVTAGAEAYNDYMSRLSDKIPYLRKLAYEKYSDEQERYLRRMSLARQEMADEEAEYDKNRSAYLEEMAAEDKEKTAREEEKTNLSAAMVKAQTGGFSSLSDSDIKTLYRAGSYYNPDTNRIVSSDGSEYALPEEDTSETGGNSSGVDAILLKFRYKGTGMAALSNSDIEELINAGYTFNGSAWVAPDGTVTEPVLKKTGSSSGSKKSTASGVSSSAKNKAKNKAEKTSESKSATGTEKKTGTSWIKKKTIEPTRWRPGKSVI